MSKLPANQILIKWKFNNKLNNPSEFFRITASQCLIGFSVCKCVCVNVFFNFSPKYKLTSILFNESYLFLHKTLGINNFRWGSILKIKRQDGTHISIDLPNFSSEMPEEKKYHILIEAVDKKKNIFSSGGWTLHELNKTDQIKQQE